MKGTVLLVEDEFDARQLLSRALERAGYRCIAVGNAREALDQARASHFVDVVVTDVVLGDDGREGLRLIGELHSIGVQAPVVVITAYADVEKVKFALNEGASYFLEKPFSGADLIKVIEQIRAQGESGAHATEQALANVPLTEKERRVARHLLNGLTSTEIAEIERNSPKTIRQHVSQVYAKCGVGSRAEFFRWVYVR